MLRQTLIAVFLILPVPDAAALADTPVDPQTLNRSGHWAEAGRAARKLLADPGLTPRERCETWFQLIYADTHTGNRESARNGISAFDGECADYPPTMWFRREVEKLRAELDPQRVPRPTIRDDDGWSAADPEALGLNVRALSEHRELCEASGADACLVAYRGRIVQEWYGPGYREPMYTMSSVKSWTGLLAGLLIADGKLGLDDPVAKYIPEWKAGAEAGVTVRHLLEMTSGLARRGPKQTSVGNVADKNRFVFSLPLTYAPGSRWSYSNEGVQLLSPILERAAGVPLEQYADAHLFSSLKMADTHLHVDEAGAAWTYADAGTTLRDFAKICQLMLDGGRWGGKQVIPEAWVKKSTTPTAANPRYGLLWRLESEPVVYATRGYLHTDCYAIPELHLAIARMQRNRRKGATASYGAESGLSPELADLYRSIVRKPE